MRRSVKYPAARNKGEYDYTAAVVEKAINQEHLRLLAIFHYVLGGLTIATSSFFLFHVCMGIMMLAAGTVGDMGTAGLAPGVVMTAIGTTLVLAGWTFGGLTIYAGRCLRQYKHRRFAIVMSVLNCLELP